MKRASVMVLVVGVVLFAVSLNAFAYKKTKVVSTPPETGNVASQEQLRSMLDCQEYATNHQSKGRAADKAMFKKEYGEPLGAMGATSEYKYDTYSRILLDCSEKKCTCRCAQ